MQLRLCKFNKHFHIVMFVMGMLLAIAGCSSNGKSSPGIDYLAKSDIDTVADIHRQRSKALLETLAGKLYRRNPLYCKRNGALLEDCINKALAKDATWRRQRTGTCTGSLCIEQGLAAGFQGDRVLAVLIGLQDMLDAAYGHKDEFYLTDQLDPQKLYNVARNIEITVWRIANRRDSNGNRYILTDAISGDARNLSYERLFGKLISLQDTLSEIIAERDNRHVKNIIQRLATAVFLPI